MAAPRSPTSVSAPNPAHVVSPGAGLLVDSAESPPKPKTTSRTAKLRVIKAPCECCWKRRGATRAAVPMASLIVPKSATTILLLLWSIAGSFVSTGSEQHSEPGIAAPRTRTGLSNRRSLTNSFDLDRPIRGRSYDFVGSVALRPTNAIVVGAPGQTSRSGHSIAPDRGAGRDQAQLARRGCPNGHSLLRVKRERGRNPYLCAQYAPRQGGFHICAY